MRSKEKKRLTRSSSDKIIAGVMGGFGAYFGINSNYIRVGFVIVSILSHALPGILVYILLLAIMPADPNKPHWTNPFENQRPTETNHDNEKRERKVIHDVDEHDD
ncbi:PspC domain-containing protein [Paucilactobacillus wasatchensis]|uniref:Transcriptional regulator n=1 Tax=Paucilactobacillus wasatchensis TaxID=1335616 RepID=A0A0D0Y3V7_9LACO|nr:PspC domain-containing protein [Paucilactobacillus wasatchensis]KIS02943.1 transcriptional regulator [Paucilactobacillus wasatchensis]